MTDVGEILTQSERDMGLSGVGKRNRVDIFCRLSTMHKRVGQTNHRTCNVDTDSRYRFSAMSQRSFTTRRGELPKQSTANSISDLGRIVW